ncbi:MAG: GPW/gp25 family protein [Chloroflexota bacterium]
MSGRDFLGVGWSFPIKINPQGGLSFISAEEDIQQAIWIILSTAKGERQMRPNFGCGIHDYVFGNNDPITWGNIAHQVRQALVEWEPRIDVIDVQVEGDPNERAKLLIRVDYRIRSNNAFHNLVYPFYIQEGAGA